MAMPANLLIANNQFDTQHGLTEMLKKEGYQVRKVSCGSDALDTILDQLPDLIVLDICLSDMNGYEICAALKAEPSTADIPIIFLSATGDVPERVKAFQIGGADYIEKPYHPEEILARIQYQLARQQRHKHLQHMTAGLEQQVLEQAAQLQQAIEFEATLKRITDLVRDSLDEQQVIQLALQELAIALFVSSCNASFYNASRTVATVQYEYDDGQLPYVGRIIHLSNFPEIYQPLCQGQILQFCSALNEDRGKVTLLACPIRDAHEILGDLWLVRPGEELFLEQDVRLVQQVANQCGIALRQARLYQAAQRQVEELERLNRLKEDFLSTISHELRTPMTNIKVTIGLFEMLVKQISLEPTQLQRFEEYLEILTSESDREIKLINDLLSLTHLESNPDVLDVAVVDLYTWLPHVLERFEERVQRQQQRLQVMIPDNLPLLVTNRAYLEHILTELLTNACKYTLAGESIIFSIREQPECLKETGQRLPCLIFSVSNTGSEIPAKELDLIFEQFYRIPNRDPWKHGGTGLGLTLARKLVKRLNGHISVQSSQEATTFQIHLPIPDLFQ